MNIILQFKDKILDNAFVFNLVRSVTDSRDNLLKIVQKELAVKEDEKIIDIGCGLGNFSQATPGDYTGIDLNKSFIKFAKKKYRNKNKKFLVMDATKLPYSNNNFDKSMFLSMLHHFSEEENQKVLKELARVTKKYIVILDTLPTKKFVAGFLVKMDRGNYIRPLEEQLIILKKHFKIISCIKHNAFLSYHSLIICEPLK